SKLWSSGGALLSQLASRSRGQRFETERMNPPPSPSPGRKVKTFLLRDWRSDLRTNGQGREPQRAGREPCLYRGLPAGEGGGCNMWQESAIYVAFALPRSASDNWQAELSRQPQTESPFSPRPSPQVPSVHVCSS
ncbi:hypothetical protein KUCAC02_025356, partial [Chaenocephalus aceratus]